MTSDDRSAFRTSAVVVLQGLDGDVVLGPLSPDSPCDIGLVERLLRLQLAARRLGWSIRLDDIQPELRELVNFVGLAADLIGHGISAPDKLAGTSSPAEVSDAPDATS